MLLSLISRFLILFFLLDNLSQYGTNCSQIQVSEFNHSNLIERNWPYIEYPPSKFIFVTYFTENIANHSIYSYYINHNYALKYNSHLYLLTYDETKGYDKNDQRWNKVIIIHDYIQYALQDPSLFPEYIIWLDSDLIVNDQNFNFETIINNYSKYDIIISKEINSANGIANTGCIIVKSSNYSLKFFHDWWNSWDRTLGMDQHVFEYLYKRTSSMDHIILLPENAINSIFPGLIYFNDVDPILHLAGESNFLRSNIFKIALNQQLFDQRFLLKRSDLDNINYTNIHSIEFHHINMELSLLSNYLNLFEFQNNLFEFQNNLYELKYRIREAQQSLSKFICSDHLSKNQSISLDIEKFSSYSSLSTCILLKDLFSDDIIQALRRLYYLYISLLDQLEKDSNSSAEKIVEIIQTILGVGMELLLVEKDLKIEKLVLNQSKQYTSRLYSLVSTRSYKLVLYYEFKFQEFRGIFLEKLAKSRHLLSYDDIENILIEYNGAWRIYQNMTKEYNFFGSGNGMLNQLDEGINLSKKLIHYSCQLNHFSLGLEVYQDIMEMIFQMPYYISNQSAKILFLDLLTFATPCFSPSTFSSNNASTIVKLACITEIGCDLNRPNCFEPILKNKLAIELDSVTKNNNLKLFCDLIKNVETKIPKLKYFQKRKVKKNI